MSKFKLWVEDNQVENNTQAYNTFVSDRQRENGFQAGEPASSIRVNTALRQSSLITVALMEVIAASDTTHDYKSNLASMKTLIETGLKAVKVNTATAADYATGNNTKTLNNRLNDLETNELIITCTTLQQLGETILNYASDVSGDYMLDKAIIQFNIGQSEPFTGSEIVYPVPDSGVIIQPEERSFSWYLGNEERTYVPYYGGIYYLLRGNYIFSLSTIDSEPNYTSGQHVFEDKITLDFTFNFLYDDDTETYSYDDGYVDIRKYVNSKSVSINIIKTESWGRVQFSDGNLDNYFTAILYLKRRPN